LDNLFAAISNTADGVLAIDRDQRIVSCNKAAARLLRVEEQAITGKPCYAVIGGRDENGGVICRWDCRCVMMARRQELVPTRDVRASLPKGGSVWLSVSTMLVPSRWRDLSILIHVFRDVSQQKGMERDLLDLAARMGRRVSPRSSGPAGPRRLSSSTAELTNREQQVLRVLATGVSTSTAAKQLRISQATVRNHVHSILAKLGVHTRLEAVTLAVRSGLLRLDN
jgi:PAS domain S-box-containing protein